MRRIFAVLAGILVASPVRADSDVAHARYSVVSTAGSIEIRDYAPQIVAETTVAGERGAAISEGFRRLAGYIFGANAPQTKIAMTAPVAQTRDGPSATAGAWKVRFFMPSEYDSLSSLPRPNDAAVGLARAPATRMAAIRFSGLAGDDDLSENEARLREYLAAQGLSAKGAAIYAFYDPPWTPPWSRRNEVMVEISRR